MKNRDREAPLFANLNLLGRCNLDCVFCLGKDLGAVTTDVLNTPANKLPQLWEFFDACRHDGIDRIYITGQNTDPLMYPDLSELVDICRRAGFGTVGVRTNGKLADVREDVLRKFDSVGFTALATTPEVQKRLTGTYTIPNIWPWVSKLPHVRVSTVVTTENEQDIEELMFRAAIFGAKYGQVRRVSTDTRHADMQKHQQAFDRTVTYLKSKYHLVGEFAGAPIINVCGLPVTLWKTVETRVNSYNWFANGTWSREYFVVESFLGKRFD